MTNRKRISGREGMTLIEVMLVLFILMTLAGVGAVAIRAARNNARIDLTKVQLGELKQALERYELHAGYFPTTLEELAQPVEGYEKEVTWDTPPLDSWKNSFNYQYPGSSGNDTFDLWSNGPDGQSGTDDDIWPNK